MDNSRAKKISAITTFCGIAIIIALEAVNSPTTIDGETISAANLWITRLSIAFAGFGRWYLMYEGTALEAHSKRDAKAGQAFSIITSAAILLYGCFLFAIDILHDHTFGLFLLANLTVIFVEYVYARRSSYTEIPEVTRWKADFEKMEKWGDGLKVELDKLKAAHDLLTKQAADDTKRAEILEEANQNRQDKIEQMSAALNALKKRLAPGSQCAETIAAGRKYFFIDHEHPQRRKFMVNKTGQKVYMTSNNAAKLVDPETREIMWTKE